jgi:hypothetical protein
MMVWCVGLTNARGGARNSTFFSLFLEEANRNSTVFFSKFGSISNFIMHILV